MKHKMWSGIVAAAMCMTFLLAGCGRGSGPDSGDAAEKCEKMQPSAQME